MTRIEFLRKLIKRIMFFFKISFLCIIAFLGYKFFPHQERKSLPVYGIDIISYWKWGKVWRQDIIDVTNPQKVRAVYFYSKKLPFLVTPNFRFCVHPLYYVKEGYEDNNNDGIWDIHYHKGPKDSNITVEEDTDYDGKVDKKYEKPIFFK